jgi:hypothetical protein
MNFLLLFCHSDAMDIEQALVSIKEHMLIYMDIDGLSLKSHLAEAIYFFVTHN